MSRENKVIWSEGLFIKPAHFQQDGRYTESYVNKRCDSQHPYLWGFDELTLDRVLLQQGKIAIKSATGIMPDGTPFNIPEDDPAPAPLEIQEGALNEKAYLCLPLRSSETEVFFEHSESGMQRYNARSIEVNDVTSSTYDKTTLYVGSLRLSLLLENDSRSEYSCISVADLVECSKDKIIALNEDHIPPSINACQSPRLMSLMKNTLGLLQQRSKELSSRISASATGTGGVAEVEDFLSLQLINRYTQLIRHLTLLPTIHPEALYQHLLMLVGELSTFSDQRFMADVEPYRHDELHTAFAPLDQQLRDALSTLSTKKRSFSIPLKEPKYGIYRAPVNDPDLFDTATFIVAVKADLPTAELQQMFNNQAKVSAIETIRDIIMASLPGINLKLLPYNPRELPYHDGYIFYELDRSSNAWQSLKGSTGFAIHIAGNIPGIKLQFWAVQR
ncbi:Uncharacterised protein [BD1-7 clade bacterium]|uniref:Type VI secretion system-associated protein n=1 Tax=BD1-7 clade bacterium TaxID=2029982 RepID=A0A5S9P1D8_9GAMM|nr:Uncharacterised protein [BD1-7 clade bacterium]CAA0116117.1 Uncharacterised protein [BD1-7 clade bacterium]CAA0119785.1 Uncharacterised protein [BD1-7 clade bacterium]